MTRTRSIAVVVLAVAAATLLFWLVIHQISALWLDVALRPEVRLALQRSMEDQKKLRALDGARSDQYRRRFETTSKLLQRLDVIRMNREQMLRRFELTLVTIFAVVSAIVAIAVWMRYRRAQAFERRQYLERVSLLQETAMRQAHEIKGPLTAARLELERLGDVVRGEAGEAEIAAALQSVNDELERVSRFAREHTSFAAIGQPVARRESLKSIVEEFSGTFADAWPNVTLRFNGGDALVCADRDMIRQVLVNLCMNSASAIGQEGEVIFGLASRGGEVHLDVSDTGDGIPESLRAHVFDPYVTTRRVGEGMGLGLAISRKIMLDHGGDLQLVSTSSSGTTFRLSFRETECS